MTSNFSLYQMYQENLKWYSISRWKCQSSQPIVSTYHQRRSRIHYYGIKVHSTITKQIETSIVNQRHAWRSCQEYSITG